jgi:hypothetical protein
MMRIMDFMAFQHTTVATPKMVFTRIGTFNKLYIHITRLRHFMPTVRQFNLHFYCTPVFLHVTRLRHFMPTVRQFNLHFYCTPVFLWVHTAMQFQ